MLSFSGLESSLSNVLLADWQHPFTARFSVFTQGMGVHRAGPAQGADPAELL